MVPAFFSLYTEKKNNVQWLSWDHDQFLQPFYSNVAVPLSTNFQTRLVKGIPLGATHKVRSLPSKQQA